MKELLMMIVLLAIPVLILLYFVFRWWSRSIIRKNRELSHLMTIGIPPSSHKSYLAPEAYTVPTFQVPKLMDLAAEPNYPARDTALGYVDQYFSKDYARPDKYFERVALKLLTDAEVQNQTWNILKKYCERFGKGSLMKKAGKIREETQKAVEPLIAVLKHEDGEVRWRAAEALGKIGDPRAVEPLISALRDKSGSVRSNAARALRRITKPNFGQDQAEWQKWWDENKEEMLKDR